MRVVNGMAGTLAVLVLGLCGVAAQAQTAPAAGQETSAGPNTPPQTAAKAGKSAMPAGAKGVCKDGTYATTGTRSSACKAHKGVKTWFSDGN